LSVIAIVSAASTISSRLRCAATAAKSLSFASASSSPLMMAVLTDELNRVCGIELAQREQGAGHGRPRSEIAPHGVQRDPRQGYASLASTRCLPP
jgi:hypothetical protein